mgnify:CR=1 FL=1
MLGFVLAASLLAVAVLGWGRLTATDLGAATPAGRSTTTALAGVQELLDRRVAAARSGDASAWLADLDPSATSMLDRQRALFRSLRALKVEGLTLRAERFLPGPAVRADGTVGDGTARVDAVGAWTLPGVDARPAPFAVELTVRRQGAGWVLVDDTAVGTVRQAFDLPGLQVRRTAAGVVAGNASAAHLDEVAADLAGARAQVERAWGRLAHLPAVVVPRTEAEFASLTRRTGQDTSQVAAVTYGMLEEGSTARGDRVVVNPRAWSQSTRQGRRIVLAHELTHLAVRGSTTHPVPQWLSEGYAVHRSYAGLQVDPRQAAPELLDAVARGRLPTSLPADARFEGAASGTAYDEAWLLVDWLARTYGEETLRRVYREAGAGGSVEEALGRIGLSETDLLVRWQQELRRLAGAPQEPVP